MSLVLEAEPLRIDAGKHERQKDHDRGTGAARQPAEGAQRGHERTANCTDDGRGCEGAERRHPATARGYIRISVRAAWPSALVNDPKLLLLDEPFGKLDSLISTPAFPIRGKMPDRGAPRSGVFFSGRSRFRAGCEKETSFHFKIHKKDRISVFL
ncbi:hypothetical protein P7F60_23320 [Rhizobium sp. YJ-22]|nr:hypothetical protein [Rhizobium sp. YJ-22]MDG3579324.1 hypothetical protein [Rhizobium sp. YJ-22]